MLFRNLLFFLSEALRGLFKNGWMSLASIGVVAIALLIFGIFVLLNMNVERWSSELRDQIEIVAFVEEEASTLQRENLREFIAEHPHVVEAEFISRYEAFEDLKETLGEQAVEGYGQDFNPLRDSFVIRAEEPEMVFGLLEDLEEQEAVAETESHKEVVDQLTSFTNAMQTAAMTLMILLAITATFLIAHTIRLTVMLRSKEIMIMKYVGASNSFIRLPFLFEGLFLGLLGTVIPLICLYFGYSSLLEVVDVELAFMPMVPFEEAIQGAIRMIIPMGIGLGVIGSIFSIGRYLRV